MANLYPQLIKIPAFMTKFININNLNSFKKLFLILKGKLTIFIFGLKSKKIICFYLNNFFVFEGKLIFEDNNFIKLKDSKKIYYPNLRITRILIDEKQFLDFIFDSYLLSNLSFNDGDVVLDCGANVGELFLAFENKNIDIEYIGIEPDQNAYFCLNKNTKSKSLNICLSNSVGEIDFYIDELGANSSIHESTTTNEKERIDSNKLDNIFLDKKIKLLKIDAEGHELEVLQGGVNSLENIEFISVDCGPEKGLEQNITFIEVNNYLNLQHFKLIDINKDRLVALYQNEK